MFDTCKFIENYFLEKSKLSTCNLYNEQREDLKKRILSSATVFFYGGRVYVLVNRLRLHGLIRFIDRKDCQREIRLVKLYKPCN